MACRTLPLVPSLHKSHLGTFTCACGVAHVRMNTCGVEYGCGLGGELHGCTVHGSADHSRVPLLELGSMGCALRRDVMCPPCCARMQCPDEFIVGYGIDYAEKYRQLPYIGVPKPEFIKLD